MLISQAALKVFVNALMRFSLQFLTVSISFTLGMLNRLTLKQTQLECSHSVQKASSSACSVREWLSSISAELLFDILALQVRYWRPANKRKTAWEHSDCQRQFTSWVTIELIRDCLIRFDNNLCYLFYMCVAPASMPTKKHTNKKSTKKNLNDQ